MITSLLLPFSWCVLLLALLSMAAFSSVAITSPAYAANADTGDSGDEESAEGEDEDERPSSGFGQKFNSMTNSLPPPNPYVVEGLGESDLSALTALAQKQPADTQTQDNDLRRRPSGAQEDSKEGSKTSSTARERWLKAWKAVRAPGFSSAPPPASPAEKVPANESRKRKADPAVDQKNNPRQKRQRVTDGRVTKISVKNVINTPKGRPTAKKPPALSAKRSLSVKASNVRGTEPPSMKKPPPRPTLLPLRKIK